MTQNLPPDQYAIGIDENDELVGSEIDESQINYAVLGKPTTSTTQNDVGTGVKTFTLDTDNGITVDDPVRIKSLDDPSCWMYGICVSRDTGSYPVEIEVLVYRCSDLTITGLNWQIQRTPNFASLSSSVLGYATDSLEFGSGNDVFVGANVSISTDANKLFSPGSHIIVSHVTDSTQYFRGVSQSYDASTGALSLFVTDVGSLASGIYAAWSVVGQDGPSSSPLLNGVSNTTIDISATAVGDSVLFSTSLPSSITATGSLVYFYSASDVTAFLTGQVSSFTPDVGIVYDVRIKVLTVGGSGSHSDWIMLLMTPPLGTGQGISAKISEIFLNNLGTGTGGNTVGIYQDTSGNNLNDNNVVFKPTGVSKDLSIAWDNNYTFTVAGTSSLSGTNTGDQDLSGYVTTSRTVNGHALSSNVTVTASDVSLGSVTNDAQTKASIVPNTAPAAGEILIGNAGGTAYAKNALSGDVTITSAGVAAIKSSVALAGSPTTTTQSAGDNSTKIGTTAYADAGDAATLTTAEAYTDAQIAAHTAAGWSVVGTANTAFPTGANSLSVTGITKDDLLIYFTGVSSTSAGWTLRIQPNGDTTAADYAMQNVVTPAAGTVASLFNPAGSTTAAANTTSGIVQISGAQQAVTKPVNSSGIIGSNRSISLGSWESTAVIASITFLLTAGNFDAGTYTVMQRGG